MSFWKVVGAIVVANIITGLIGWLFFMFALANVFFPHTEPLHVTTVDTGSSVVPGKGVITPNPYEDAMRNVENGHGK